MTARPVEAVFFWRYTVSAFRATYGRINTSTTYSKDFLQSRADQFPVIDAVLGWTGGQIDIEYRWPGGGQRAGRWRHSTSTGEERGQLAWLPASETPVPWRLGDPDADPAITFRGNRAVGNEAVGDAEWARIEAEGRDGYLVAVKLVGEDGVLHPRAYYRDPPADQPNRALAQLPKVVRDAIDAVPSGNGAIRLDTDASARAPRARRLVGQILSALQADPNVLLVGPPGTGKTVALEDLRSIFETGGGGVFFNPDLWDEPWCDTPPVGSDTKTVSLVFHPSYAYENFVAGLTPTGGVGLTLEARPGPLVSFAHWAAGSARAGLLILDEFNRGPAAAIFGDTLALLDRDKRDRPGAPGAWIERPFAGQPMTVANEFRDASGNNAVADRLTLPASVNIVAAMNSTDRSVAPIDAALRRRFAIIHVGPDPETLAARLGTSLPTLSTPFVAPATWAPEDVRQLAVRLLIVLNDRVLAILGQDFLLGHSLLWHVAGDNVDALAASLAHAFDERIAATLRLTFADQDEALAVALAIDATATSATIGAGHWVIPEGRLEAVAPRRLVVRPVSLLENAHDRLAALAAVLAD